MAEHYPPTFKRYIEPFVGSGAVFFDLLNAGRLQGRQIQLADVNADLIGCYRTLRERPEDVIRELATLQQEHRSRGNACYYEVRDERFNPRRAALAAIDQQAVAASVPSRPGRDADLPQSHRV